MPRNSRYAKARAGDFQPSPVQDALRVTPSPLRVASVATLPKNNITPREEVFSKVSFVDTTPKHKMSADATSFFDSEQKSNLCL
jgi:hypothetical protein